MLYGSSLNLPFAVIYNYYIGSSVMFLYCLFCLSTVKFFYRKFRLRRRHFSFRKMSPAHEGSRSPSLIRFGSVNWPSANVFSIFKDKSLFKKSEMAEKNVKIHAKDHAVSNLLPDHVYVEEGASLSSNTSTTPKSNKRKKRIDLGSESDQKAAGVNSSQTKMMSLLNSTSPLNESAFSTPYTKKRISSSPSSQIESQHAGDSNKLDSSEGLHNFEPFDICFSRYRNYGVQKPSLHREYKENQNESEKTAEGSKEGVLRPGMVLLKGYLALSDQIAIVKTCQILGKGPGGFYKPGYKDGAKLRLQMMCLGLNWDPETKYIDRRPIDGCEAPSIPDIFRRLVLRAIRDAQALIEKDSRVSNVEEVLPSMSPDICIVNFYTTTGRLGLHQDRDESPESLEKGLPVVSISVGDSAEFLYGDQRKVENTEKVVLESGDVLIFGGESRHVYHGVSSIIPNSAPLPLLQKSRLRPGRLNLTFRQY